MGRVELVEGARQVVAAVRAGNRVEDDLVDKSTGEVVDTCSIVTTDANELIAPMHDRMPVILPRHVVQHWLDFDAKPEELQGMTAPYPADKMERYRISTVINSASVAGWRV